MISINGLSRAAAIFIMTVCFSGCVHRQVTTSDLTPENAVAFNTDAQGKPYNVTNKDGSSSQGPSGLAVRLTSQREWFLSPLGPDMRPSPSQRILLGGVEKICIVNGDRKSASRGFWDGALLGLATGASLGAILGASSSNDDDFLFDRGDVAVMGGVAGGLVGGLVGAIVGGSRESTIRTEIEYSPKGF
jgi:hypothetical protein